MYNSQHPRTYVCSVVRGDLCSPQLVKYLIELDSSGGLHKYMESFLFIFG